MSVSVFCINVYHNVINFYCGLCDMKKILIILLQHLLADPLNAKHGLAKNCLICVMHLTRSHQKHRALIRSVDLSTPPPSTHDRKGAGDRVNN